ETWNLVSPKTQEIIKTVKARDIWIRILTARIETGEPYLLFSDRVKEQQPAHHKKLGLKVKTSNLCSEITLPTGLDHQNQERTAICCLSSLNLEKWFEWHKEPKFIEDVMRFLDNILSDFIKRAPEEMYRAVYSAIQERSVGLGVMGFHSFLQSNNLPFESAIAKSWNKRMFKHIREKADEASKILAIERGECPDSAQAGGFGERFSHKLAVAPTASISVIAGNSSPGIEPYAANVFLQKTLSGSFTVKNKHLKKMLDEKGHDNAETWSKITANKGSVQKLKFLTKEEKEVFKTAFEIDQRWIIEHAADRTEYICQSQSVNLFLAGDVHKRDLHQVHLLAWKKGLKSLYYCRSLAVSRTANVNESIELKSILNKSTQVDYAECLSCQ
ncbi:MAG: ribonucleoside-diphosphate reductase subunit alpha, partial [Pseudomonadota bacterium]|nr:ribonucleoside-diphosphate reductase subunit alpha [Pseudomonadota bacterium]